MRLFSEVRLFGKSLRVLQTPDQLVFFSDVYDVCEDALERFVTNCARVGLRTKAFVSTYPRVEYCNGYEVPSKARLVNFGYSHLYRGTLCGVAIDARVRGAVRTCVGKPS